LDSPSGVTQNICRVKCCIINIVVHQEIGDTLAWPDRFDNTESGWCHMISLYMELTLVKIMVIDLPTYIGGYHLDITRPFLAILTKTWSNFINAVQNLGVIYNYLYFACVSVQFITILAKTAMKTNTHIQPAPVTQTRYKKRVVSSQFSHGIFCDPLRIKW